MRRLAVLALMTLAASACGGDERRLEFPASPQGRLISPTPGDLGAEAPAGERYSVDGCPVEPRRFCHEASTLANAIVQASPDAILALTQPLTVSCADADLDRYPQCQGRQGRELRGIAVAGADPETLLVPEERYLRRLTFMAEGVDPDYSDELGGGGSRIVGVSTCRPGEWYQLVFTAGLGDPTSELPPIRFLGTFELTERGRAWAISRSALDILSDWQLLFDDPLADAGCGRIVPWGS